MKLLVQGSFHHGQEAEWVSRSGKGVRRGEGLWSPRCQDEGWGGGGRDVGHFTHDGQYF